MASVYDRLLENISYMCELDEETGKNVVSYLRKENLIDYDTLKERFPPDDE